MPTESERLQSELEPLELVHPSIAAQIQDVKTEIVDHFIKSGMEPQDAARFVEMTELRMALEKRYDYIMQAEMSHRVKKARLNLTRKEMVTLLGELETMRDKYEKRKADERSRTENEAGDAGRGDQRSPAHS